MKKVTVIWSSPNTEGLTASAKDQIMKGLEEAGAQVEEIHLNEKKLEHCRACANGWGTCNKTGTCVIRDDFSGIYQSQSTRRSSAKMGTGLKSDVGGSTSYFLLSFPGISQSHHLSMRFSGTMMPPFSDNLAVPDNNTADSGIGESGVKASFRKLKSTLHKHAILF